MVTRINGRTKNRHSEHKAHPLPFDSRIPKLRSLVIVSSVAWTPLTRHFSLECSQSGQRQRTFVKFATRRPEKWNNERKIPQNLNDLPRRAIWKTPPTQAPMYRYIPLAVGPAGGGEWGSDQRQKMRYTKKTKTMGIQKYMFLRVFTMCVSCSYQN